MRGPAPPSGDDEGLIALPPPRPHEGRADLGGRPWTCIATNNPYSLKLSQDAIAGLAAKATTVVIRTVNKPNQCVVSRSEEDAIKRLRCKQDLSQSNMRGNMLMGDMTEDYVADQWEGAPHDLACLRNRWGSMHGNPFGLNAIYWACHNEGGLCFMSVLNSGWQYNRAADIEILIDAEPPPDLASSLWRDVLSTSGLWNPLEWDATQTASFVRSMDSCGDRHKSPYQMLARFFQEEGFTAKDILQAHSESFCFDVVVSLTSRLRDDGVELPASLAVERLPQMLRRIQLLLIVEGYALKGDPFVDFCIDSGVMSPDWGGQLLGPIYLNNVEVRPSDVPWLHLDDSDSTEWVLQLYIQTTRKRGTIFARNHVNGQWRCGSDGQGKMLFLNDGRLHFDVGWIGRISSATKLNDGRRHLVGVGLRGGRYYLLVDGSEVMTKDLFVTRDMSSAVFSIGLQMQHFMPAAMVKMAGEVQKLRQPGGSLCGVAPPWFWQPCSKYVVGFQAQVDDVLEVNSKTEVMTVKFSVTFFWHDPRLCDWSVPDDQLDLGDCGSFDEACVQAGEPTPHFLNTHEVPSLAVSRMRSLPEGCIKSTFQGIGEFYDPVDVRRFPFDHQHFTIRLSVAKSSLGSDRQLVPMHSQNIVTLDRRNSNPEWDIINATFTLHDTHADIRLIMRRKPLYYLYNVVLPLSIISLLSLTCFAVNADEYVDRFSILGTMLLTAIAFKLTYADAVPIVSYQTVLDSYVLCLFCSLGVLSVVLAVVAKMSVEAAEAVDDDWAELADWLDRASLIGSVMVWVVAHVFIVRQACV